jgi:signal transduction histidine kinase/ligand-binding sensor domain-containing protein
MRIRISIAFAWFAFFLAGVPADALDPKTQITQYRHTAWRVQEGAFESAPNAIAQTTDGYIWIGTGSGLVKYDGVRFVPWTPPAGNGLPLSAIFSLRGSSDGALWIGTGTRLLSWKNNHLREYVAGRINTILEDHHGRIWVTRSRVPDLNGGLCQVVGESPRCIGGDDRMKLPYAGPLSEDTQGNLWIGASSQLMRWKDGSFDTYFRKELEAFQGLNSVASTVALPDGSVWATIPRKGFGLFQIVHGVSQKMTPKGINPEQMDSLFVDRDGSVWLGTHDEGVYRMHGERIDHFGSEDGLSSNNVTGFFQDREGNLWLATSKGLDSFRDARVTTISRTEGLSADLAASVLASGDGDVWIGNRGSLDLLHADHLTSIPIPGQRVTSLWQDHARRLWVGVDNLLTIFENGQFRKINRRDGSPLGTAIAITEDTQQNIWVSVAGRVRELLRIRDLRVEEEFSADQIPFARLLAADPAGGIWLGLQRGDLGHYRNGKLEIFPLRSSGFPMYGLSADADGSVWASTVNGIVQWKNGEIKTLNSRNGIPCDAAFGAIRDNHSTLWIYSKCGLIGIANVDLERWWRQPDRTVPFQLFDVFDGALPGLSTFQPANSRSPDGRLWFVNDAVIQTMDPVAVRKNAIPPPVYVEELQADRKDYAVDGRLRLPARSRDIQIGYTALSFSVPQKVRFRYKLDGRDQDWQDAGTRRRAFYNDLPPAQYRFHVTASNNDGVWSETGAALDFSIAPAYYQMRWFQAGCIAVFLAGIWGFYRLRLRQVAREFNVRLEERVSERTRVARELHDTLLQSFQGLMLHFQVVDDLLPEGEAKKRLEQSLLRADQAIVEGRNAVHDLRSSATATNDLADAVNALGAELATPDSATFRLVVEGAVRDLHPIIRDEVYRITREALRNAFTHAHANHIEAEITYGKKALRLRIRDDGDGTPPEVIKEGRPGHYGLPGMRERAKQIGGNLGIWSGAGPRAGTEIELTIAASIAYPALRGRSLFGLSRSH